jgi:pimeloyl-ACP methyl ester carboxylesterase
MPAALHQGRTLHYEDVGEGLPVLLLHGFPLSSQSFWPQLEAPVRGVRLLAPDHRGFGRSSPAAGPATMEALAADALAVLDAAGLRAAVVGGVSMGGYVALALARLAPKRVRGLVLIDTQGAPDDEAGRARREAVARDVEARGAGVVAEAMLPRLLSPRAPAALVQRVDHLIRAQAPAAIAAASRGMALRADARPGLAALHVPCLVVVGADDVVTPLERARELAALVPGARLEVLPDAGHLANLEQPQAFAEALARFAASVAQAGGGSA